METLQIPETTGAPKNIREMLGDQLTSAWRKIDSEFRQTLARQQQESTLYQAQIEAIHELTEPFTVVITVDTWDARDDGYLMYEVDGSRQSHEYNIQTDDIAQILQALAALIAQDDFLSNKARLYEISLKRLGVLTQERNVIEIDRESREEMWRHATSLASQNQSGV